MTEGEVSIGDDIVNDVAPKDRDIAMVFQSYALYPHLTVQQNIEFPLRQRGLQQDGADEGVEAAPPRSGSPTCSTASPASSRAASASASRSLGRSSATPRVHLMDEPLSNLDAMLRLQTRADIVATQRRLGTTVVYVTHDQVEAMTMGHRIAVISEGRLQQIGQRRSRSTTARRTPSSRPSSATRACAWRQVRSPRGDVTVAAWSVRRPRSPTAP